MKGRMQKISYDNSQGKDRSETESTLGVQTYMGITENNFTTIEYIGFLRSERPSMEASVEPYSLCEKSVQRALTRMSYYGESDLFLESCRWEEKTKERAN
jgi:hypothetical protein